MTVLIFGFIGSWNAWVTERWTRDALPSLAHAYALTGDDRGLLASLWDEVTGP